MNPSMVYRCRSCGGPLPAGATCSRQFCDDCRAARQQAAKHATAVPLHIIADSDLPEWNRPAWVLCSCGHRCVAVAVGCKSAAEMVAIAYASHRVQVGLAPVGLKGIDRERWYERQASA